MIPVLNAMQGFTRKFQYPNISQTLATEWGGVDNVRFFISEQGSVTPNASLLGNDIANCFVAAKEAYKVVRPKPDDSKSFLIDSEARWGNEGEPIRDAERLSGRNPKGYAIVRPTTIHEIVELHRNDVAAQMSSNKGYRLLWQAGGKSRFIYLPPGYNNDPCMLRHTAGCSFYQGSYINEVVQVKSDLIDLDSCTYEAKAA